VVHVPTVEEEDRRHAHRELARLTRERTRGVNQIKGLLAAHGIHLTTLRGLPDLLPQLTQWDGQPLPAGARRHLAFAYVAPLWFVAGLGFSPWVLLPLASLPYVVSTARAVLTLDRYEALLPLTPQMARLLVLYAILLAFGVAQP